MLGLWLWLRLRVLGVRLPLRGCLRGHLVCHLLLLLLKVVLELLRRQPGVARLAALLHLIVGRLLLLV